MKNLYEIRIITESETEAAALVNGCKKQKYTQVEKAVEPARANKYRVSITTFETNAKPQ